MAANAPVSRSGPEPANVEAAARATRSPRAAGGAPPDRRLGLNDRRWCEKGGRRGHEPAYDHGPEHDGIGCGESTPTVTSSSNACVASQTKSRAWKVRDVAEFLQASESWVRHAAAGGRLPCTKIGGLLRFDPDEIRSLARADAPARVLPRKR
jgi:helix-turn-helix protein